MSAPILNDQKQATFKAMWRAGKTCAAIGLAVGLTTKQVKTMRPALGLKPRNQGGKVSINLQLPPDVVERLTEKARAYQMPRARYLAIVLSREVAPRAP